MAPPKLLDLYCGAGGAAHGYQQAGFHVTGVDLAPQPRYAGDVFIQADARTFPLDGFDAIHASPPCQGYLRGMTAITPASAPRNYPLLIAETRARLEGTGVPWVLENVPHARRELPAALLLCGTMFGLGVLRHRLFESSLLLWSPGACRHDPATRYLVVLRGQSYVCGPSDRTYVGRDGRTKYRKAWAPVAAGRAAMGIAWMTGTELGEAIPPAYTEWIGRCLMAALPQTQTA